MRRRYGQLLQIVTIGLLKLHDALPARPSILQKGTRTADEASPGEVRWLELTRGGRSILSCPLGQLLQPDQAGGGAGGHRLAFRARSLRAWNAAAACRLTPYTLGQHAVNVFFVISGLSLAASLDRRPDLRRYAAGRFLRVFPALFVAGVVVAFLLGPLVTNMGLLAYLEDGHTLFYPALVLVEFQDASPPGLFHDLPYGDAINVPLWTIRYEIAAYCALAGLFAAGLLRWRMATCVLLAAAAAIHAACAAWSASTGMTPQAAHTVALAGNVSRFGMSFLLGVAAFQFRARLSLTPLWFAVLVPAAILVSGTSLAPVAAVVFAAYATLYFGTLSYGPPSAWTRRTDISYGTYLYGGPCSRRCSARCPASASPFIRRFRSCLPARGPAFLAYVEKPLIGLKYPLSTPLSHWMSMPGSRCRPGAWPRPACTAPSCRLGQATATAALTTRNLGRGGRTFAGSLIRRARFCRADRDACRRATAAAACGRAKFARIAELLDADRHPLRVRPRARRDRCRTAGPTRAG